MNLELIDPFEQDFPEVIEDTLEDGPAVTVKFNRRGTLLAAGCSDGSIVVWDFDTRGVSRSLIGHIKTITSLSWSRNGRYLLSSSRDWNCIVWDLLTGTKKHTIRFDTPVLNAQFHPKNNSVFVAALHQEKPVIVDFSDGIKRQPIQSSSHDGPGDQSEAPSKGPVNWTLVILFEIRPTTSAIKNIQFSRRGKDFVVNSNDRVIRVFSVKDDGPPEQLHKFQDLVNRIQWNQCCLSSDSDYVIGGSAHQAEHNIYIWDKVGGNLVKILEGPKEPLEDVAWHPVRPIVASVSNFGTIHIWATNYQENWSAFAPDFKELEENIDYEEREDEFDIVPEEEASKRKHDDEDVVIDVTNIEKINPFNDSDSEDEEEMFYLPLLPSDQQDEKLMQENKRQNRRHRHEQQQQQQQHGTPKHEGDHFVQDITPSTSMTSANGNHNGHSSHHRHHDDPSRDDAHHQRISSGGKEDSEPADDRKRNRDREHDRDRRLDHGRDEYDTDDRRERSKHSKHRRGRLEAYDVDSESQYDSHNGYDDRDRDRDRNRGDRDRDHRDLNRDHDRDRERERDRDRDRDDRKRLDDTIRTIKRQK
ncbi:hypothetical protein CPC16_000545 [Podila verticillata]|nr:hypothetical protein CPC16_000545 [Podila verticillata]